MNKGINMDSNTKQHKESVEIALHRLISASLTFALAKHTACVSVSPSNDVVSIFIKDESNETVVLETILLNAKDSAQKINSVTDELNQLNCPLDLVS